MARFRLRAAAWVAAGVALGVALAGCAGDAPADPQPPVDPCGNADDASCDEQPPIELLAGDCRAPSTGFALDPSDSQLPDGWEPYPGFLGTVWLQVLTISCQGWTLNGTELGAAHLTIVGELVASAGGLPDSTSSYYVYEVYSNSAAMLALFTWAGLPAVAASYVWPLPAEAPSWSYEYESETTWFEWTRFDDDPGGAFFTSVMSLLHGEPSADPLLEVRMYMGLTGAAPGVARFSGGVLERAMPLGLGQSTASQIWIATVSVGHPTPVTTV